MGKYNIHAEKIAFYKDFGYDIESERNFILEKVKPLCGEILEVGTGKGYFAIILAKEGYKFITVDISKEEQNFAKSGIKHLGLENSVNFQIGDAKALSFTDKTFDVIISVNLIHHLDDCFAVIDEFIRLIRNNGKIILSDFNKKGLKLMDIIHKSQGRKHHAPGASLTDIENYLIDKGFKIEKYKCKLQEILIAHN